MESIKRLSKKILFGLSAKSVKVLNTCMLAFLICLFLSSLYALRNLKSEYNVKQFFPKHHTLLSAEKHVAETFKLQEKSSVAILIDNTEKKSWINRKSLKTLGRLNDDISSLDSVKKVLSLGNLQGTFELGHDLFVGNLFEQVPPKHWPRLVQTHPFIKPHLLSSNNKTSLMLVELVNNSPDTLAKFKDEVLAIKAKKYSTLFFSFAGIPTLQADISKLLKAELIRSVFIAFAVFILILVLVFKGWSGPTMAMISLVFVNVVCLGTLAIFNIPFDVLMSTLPVLISLSTISLTVHVLTRLVHETDYQNSPSLNTRFFSITATLKKVFGESFLAALTPAIGFLMLVISDVQIIQKYGKVVSLTLIFVWVLTQAVLVPLATLLPGVQLRKWIDSKAYWSLHILKSRQLIIACTTIFAAISLALFARLNWNTRLFDDLPKSNIARLNTEKIDLSFGGTLPLSIVIKGSEALWRDPHWVGQLNSLSSEIKKLPSVGSVISAADFLKKSSAEGMRLPASKQEAAETYFMYSMASEDPTVHFVNQGNHESRLEIRLKDLPAQTLLADENKIASLVKNYFPYSESSLSGLGMSVHKINAEMSKELIFGFWQSLAVIGFFLIFVFRSFRWAAMACLPNIVPPVFLIGILGLTQTPIKPSIAIIFSIAVGLAFSNTVYLLGRLKKVIREHSLQNYLPVKNMLLAEMVPCLLATVLVSSGFVVFTFSFFEMNRLFGVYMVLSIWAGAIGDLLFLPSILSRFPHLLLKNKKSTSALLAASVLVAISFVSFNAYSAPAVAPNASEILQKSKVQLASKDDSADVTMKIIEADGTSKERSLSIKRKISEKHMTLVRLKSPSDLKGTALLSVLENGEEDQWLYLPSTKQVRRVVGGNRQTGVLGSELTPDDLDTTTVRGSKAQFVKKLTNHGEDFALIEVKSASNKTRYSKALILISLKTYLPARLEYYNKQGRVVKRVDFEKYLTVGGVHRAQSIKVRNLVNKRGTDLVLTNVKSNSGLSDDEFSQRALSRE